MADKTPLTDAEYAQMKKDHATLKAAYAKDPKVTLECFKAALQDMRDFPDQSGTITK